MLVLKTRSKTKGKILTIQVPDEFENKEVEIIIRIEGNIEKEILADKIQVDTTVWRFNREEIYER